MGSLNLIIGRKSLFTDLNGAFNMKTFLIIAGICLIVYFKIQIVVWVLAFCCWIKQIMEN